MVRTCNFSYGEELWLSHTLSAAVANRYPDLGKRSSRCAGRLAGSEGAQTQLAFSYLIAAASQIN